MFSKGKGIDKKYFVFGEHAEEGEDKHLLGHIKKILRTALDGLLATSEVICVFVCLFFFFSLLCVHISLASSHHASLLSVAK